MKVGGRDFDLTRQEVEVRMKGVEPESIQKYMVEVNGRMFPPKQVLGHVTDWPRTTFTTMEAQRVLNRIGFECTEARGGSMRQAGQFVLGAFREGAQQAIGNRAEESFLEGFTAAAGIALQPIQDKLDAAREQMKSAGLSPAEQAVYAHLDELKAEIEAGLAEFWRRGGVD